MIILLLRCKLLDAFCLQALCVISTPILWRQKFHILGTVVFLEWYSGKDPVGQNRMLTCYVAIYHPQGFTHSLIGPMTKWIKPHYFFAPKSFSEKKSFTKRNYFVSQALSIGQSFLRCVLILSDVLIILSVNYEDWFTTY